MLPADKKKLTSMLLRFLAIAGAERIGVWKNEGERTTYEYNLHTPLGPLAVRFASDENHLHCRFDDVPRALTVMAGSINPYSGKYNEYVFQRCTAKHAFDEILMPHLLRIWIRAAEKIDADDSNAFVRYIRACAWMASFGTWKQPPGSVTDMFQMRRMFDTVKKIIHAYGENNEGTPIPFFLPNLVLSSLQ